MHPCRWLACSKQGTLYQLVDSLPTLQISCLALTCPFQYAPPVQFDAASARTRLNLLYTLLSFYCLMPYVTMGLYAADKKFYLSDSSSQLYSPWAYYVAKVRAFSLRGWV